MKERVDSELVALVGLVLRVLPGQTGPAENVGEIYRVKLVVLQPEVGSFRSRE